MKRTSPFTLTAIAAVAFTLLSISPLRASDGSEFDVRPIPVKTPPPEYPQQLRRSGVAGMVAVRVEVDESGNVTECSVTKSSQSEFEGPAIAAIRNWKFRPASKGGTAVKSHFIVPIKFSVED